MSLISLSIATIIKSNIIFVISSFNGGSLTMKSIDTKFHSLLNT